MSRRMEVNRTDGGRYAVIDDGAVLGPFPTRAAAFAEVVARGGRVHLQWRRTVIAGETKPKDFTGEFEGSAAGRIYPLKAGLLTGSWQAFPHGHNPDTNTWSSGSMVVDTRDEAIELIERIYTKLIAGPDAKPPANSYAKAKGG